ncbi:peroxiredoxin [Dyella sp.]|uniref:peroxiredoxin n=1 Tax=Dyella sp. TaxID=1869338 RepID=UPI002D77985C|nr:peroxiredoxin [Dyella sp.]HET6433968.1 peroxiredoxin [Dyella sp.]
MTIEIGQTPPDVPLTVVDGGTALPTGTAAVFAGRRMVMFAVPGAFTPTCSEHHMPGFVAEYPHFRARGIDVCCLSVNDAFVMQAWAADQHVPAGLLMLADGNGAFTRALGLELDGSAYGLGPRARRFALYAVDGVVRQLHIEAAGELRVSSAEAMLASVTD